MIDPFEGFEPYVAQPAVEKGVSCKYCDPNFEESVEADASERLAGEPMEMDFGFLGTLNFALYIEHDVLTLFTDDGGVNHAEKKYAINYCPICGRKVREAAKK